MKEHAVIYFDLLKQLNISATEYCIVYEICLAYLKTRDFVPVNKADMSEALNMTYTGFHHMFERLVKEGVIIAREKNEYMPNQIMIDYFDKYVYNVTVIEKNTSKMKAFIEVVQG